MTWLLNVLYALDLLANAIFGGEQNETVSARWGAMRGKVRLWYWACRTFNWFDKGHCERSAARHEKIKEATK